MLGRYLLLLLVVLQLAAAQTDQRADQERTRPLLRPRYVSVSPAELLQRVTAARAAFATTSEEPETTTASHRAHRKQYPSGRRQPQQQNDSAASLKELLKQAGTLSLSEILQQKNVSLTDLLQSKKLAASVLKQGTRPAIPTEPTSTQAIVEYFAESTTKRPVRDSLYNTGQRTSYLQSKRLAMTPPPVYHDLEEQRWSTPADDKQGDSREDILELLQPGNGASLASILSSRNMTLAELMDHRERGARQRQLADLFSDLVLKKAPGQLANSEFSSKASSRHINELHVSSTTAKPRGSRDPRLLDMQRRNPYLEGQPDMAESGDVKQTAPETYDYEEDEDEGEDAMPVAVKSAIIASGGLLALTLALFAVIFLCCRLQQRKRRGSRAPFFRNSKLAKSERSVVIQPAEFKTKYGEVDF